MKLQLKLKTSSDRISVNYQYALSSVIYKILKFGSPEFSEFLHEKGYSTNGKIYKLFTFSLRFEKIQFKLNYLEFTSPNVYLFVSSPLVDEFIKNIVIGSLRAQSFEIYADYITTKFSIEQAELVPEINYSNEMKFKMLSPMVLSTYNNFNNKKSQYYFRYDDDINAINKVFNRNLDNKYKLIHNKEYDGKPLELNWDDEYIKRQLARGKRISKKISIMKDIDNVIDVISIQTPFIVKGNPELIKVGYECGFGEKNSMGFGMAEAV